MGKQGLLLVCVSKRSPCVTGFAVLAVLPGLLTYLSFLPAPGRCLLCVCFGERPMGPLCKSLFLRMERSSARCNSVFYVPWPLLEDCFTVGPGLAPHPSSACLGSPNSIAGR